MALPSFTACKKFVSPHLPHPTQAASCQHSTTTAWTSPASPRRKHFLALPMALTASALLRKSPWMAREAPQLQDGSLYQELTPMNLLAVRLRLVLRKPSRREVPLRSKNRGCIKVPRALRRVPWQGDNTPQLPKTQPGRACWPFAASTDLPPADACDGFLRRHRSISQIAGI